MTAFGIERDPGADVREMADLVMAAAQRWSVGSTHHAERVLGQIADSTGSPYGKGIAGWAVQSILDERIGLTFEHGWQPVDLDRLVARKLKDPARVLLGDAMAHHLSTYARRTVDPDWWDQMQGPDATVWWPTDRSYPEARARTEPWPELVRASVALVALVWGLPPIESLGPAPGQAHHRPTTAGPDVEPRILERVRRLLAKAESTTFEAEAETFTAGAQALMARHSIDVALLASSAPTTDGPVLRRIGVGNPYESPKVALLTRVAAANYSRAVWTRELGYVTVIGHREDLDAVETLFTSLLVQATTVMAHQGKRTDGRGGSRTTAFRRSFLSAFAHRIGERLQEVADAEVQAVADERVREGSSSGQELVPLLEKRREAVDETVDDVFTQVRMQRTSAATDAEGWYSGTAAADRASLRGSAELDG